MAKHGDEHDAGEAPEATGLGEPLEADGAQPTEVVETGDDGSGATLVIETDAADEQPTEVFEPYAAAGAAAGASAAAGSAAAPEGSPTDAGDGEPRPRRRLSRAARVWIIVGVVLAVVVALVVVADIVARGIAEQRVAEEVEANLPDGVDGDVSVTIGGFSVIAQYLSGTMQHVELDAPELT
ncbi:MAG TPA: LmeA family phospholipid-binding protein, partial [Agromyces sp.]